MKRQRPDESMPWWDDYVRLRNATNKDDQVKLICDIWARGHLEGWNGAFEALGIDQERWEEETRRSQAQANANARLEAVRALRDRAQRRVGHLKASKTQKRNAKQLARTRKELHR